jgi:hypothetical protein
MGTFKVRKTTEQFIKEAIAVHGDKYDYSKVEYKTGNDKVCIICPKHGEFLQTPYNHLQGCGCKMCVIKKRNIGVCDLKNVVHLRSYRVWKGIIGRCYLNKRSSDASYSDCYVCEEWLIFSNFKRWFEDPQNGYVEGYDIDKDIMIKNNRVYSPQTCCFLPPKLNKVFTKRKSCRGSLPLGARFSTSGKYDSRIRRNKKDYYLGTYNTPEEAFTAYKLAKEQYIKELAESYFQQGKITKRVYNALMKYEVEITD